MLSTSSIRQEFVYKLVPAFGVLVFLFSYVVFTLIQNKIYDDIRTELTHTAEILVAKEDLLKKRYVRTFEISYKENYDIRTTINRSLDGFSSRVLKLEDRVVYEIKYPITIENGYFLVVRKDISDMRSLLDSIQNIIIFLNILATLFIGVFSFLLSKILAKPIKKLTQELSKMDEESLKRLNRSEFPDEFRPLAKTLNMLLSKIDGHIKYQKELFVGLAHELKTPLAVIKTKNSVALMKTRDVQKYQEILKHNNKVVDEMNKMTSSILDIGRAEYAQLAPSKSLNISKYLEEKAKDFQLLVESKNIEFRIEILPYEVECFVGDTLINHILQNFIQNAAKFTPEGKVITLRAYFETGVYTIEVIDEGCGVSDTIDPFAPFIREGDKKGVGLGLFLAKNAANAMNAEIGLKKREDKEGTIAFLKFSC